MDYAKTVFGKILEGMIDKIGMEKVLLTLAAVCDAKAERVANSIPYTEMATRLEKLAAQSTIK